MSEIHPLSSIHPNAKIGNNVSIGPFVHIDDNVEIGDNTWIGPNATIFSGARIGRDVKIFPGAVVSGIPQDLKFEGEDTLTIIGDRTTIRECVTVSRGTKDRHQTVIGQDCLIMAYAHVAHDCIIGDHCILANAVQLAGHVIVEDFAIVGGASAVHQFVKIGKHVMVSGGSLVRKDIPPYSIAAREPLSFCGVNTVGLRRREFSREVISIIQDTYRLIYQSGMNINKGMDMAEATIPDIAERNEILKFIRSSERGIMKGYAN
jgi:UDP-N-acetylglucosamine acyltransferase